MADAPTTPPTVFIVDDDAGLRTALEQLVRSVRLRVQSFASAQEFLADFRADQPGCVVADVRMPGLSGLDLQKRLVEQGQRIPVIIMTGHAEVEMAVQAVKAGALDFVQKPYSAQRMLELIQRALDADAERRRQDAELTDFRARLQSLSDREKQVLDFLVEGKVSKEIALLLNIRPPTADFHRRNVLEKMHVDNAVQLARLFEANRRSQSSDGA